jgi:hypothetical protein
MTTGRGKKLNTGSSSAYITQTELKILECHYLAADLLELADAVPFVELNPVRALSAAMTIWANETTLIIEDLRRFINDRTTPA